MQVMHGNVNAGMLNMEKIRLKNVQDVTGLTASQSCLMKYPMKEMKMSNIKNIDKTANLPEK